MNEELKFLIVFLFLLCSSRADQIVLLRLSIGQGDQDHKLTNRRSFFRRSKKGNHSYTVSHSRESSDSAASISTFTGQPPSPFLNPLPPLLLSLLSTPSSSFPLPPLLSPPSSPFLLIPLPFLTLLSFPFSSPSPSSLPSASSLILFLLCLLSRSNYS